MKTVGIDIGGTKIKAGLVEGAKVLKIIEIETEANKGKQKVIKNITKAIESVLEKDVRGIGVGFAGVVDNKGVVLISPHIKALERFNIKKHFRKKFSKRVEVGNEVRAATLAEARYGAGRKYKNIMLITIGTGIGGGIMANGRIYKGKGNAGEAGHTTINFDGIKSSCCKNYGCFEEYVSARGLQRNFGEKKNPEEIAEMAARGNVKARKAYQEMGRNLGVGIINIANMLNPDIVIVNGGIARSWKLFEKEMRKTIKERGFLGIKVAKARLTDGGIIGAALLLERKP